MLEDKLLIWKFKRGSKDAACRIYEKYKNYLLTLAAALLNDISAAEDIVHTVFVNFTQEINTFELNGSLKGYLAACVTNSARNAKKAKQNHTLALEEAANVTSNLPGPEHLAIHREDLQRLIEKMNLLEYEQKEVIILHLKGGLKFRQIAGLQDVSINTVQSRYRYGLAKLRSLFNGELTQ